MAVRRCTTSAAAASATVPLTRRKAVNETGSIQPSASAARARSELAANAIRLVTVAVKVLSMAFEPTRERRSETAGTPAHSASGAGRRVSLTYTLAPGIFGSSGSIRRTIERKRRTLPARAAVTTSSVELAWRSAG